MDEDEIFYIRQSKNEIDKALSYLLNTEFRPNKENNEFLEGINEEKISSVVSLQKIVARSSFNADKLKKLVKDFENLSDYSLNEILNEAKYHHYIAMQKEQIKKMKSLNKLKIPKDFDFRSISGLSNEVVEKLEKNSPSTLFAASMISGITPAALDILQIHIKLRYKNVTN